ncbi:MAG: reverse transcriptase family protein [Sedimenticola sp.]
MAKRCLRQQQRLEQSSERKQFYEKLMNNPTSKMFYQLIRRNKGGNCSNTQCIMNGQNEIFDISEQRHYFAKYYEDLAIPKQDHFEDEFLELCEIRQEIIQSIQNDKYTLELFTEKDTCNAIDCLNTGKSPDEYGLSAEHLKSAKDTISPYLTQVFNTIITEETVPEIFKTGILTPVPKKGKDPKHTENYRGITVTAVLGKVFEHLLLQRLIPAVKQSSMQFGFTKGLSPTLASLIVSEAQAELRTFTINNLYLATLDAQKAFDVVHHTILLDKLSTTEAHPKLQSVVKDLYSDLSSKVKWAGDLSESFPIRQGVRQGGILSTFLYKLYLNDLLDELQSNSVGLSLGTEYAGSPCCADDVVLLSVDRHELQTMLSTAYRYSKQHRYNLHPKKSQVINYKQNKPNCMEENVWKLGENTITATTSTVHLGVIRTPKNESQINIDDRVSTARRTLYALINTGLHGTNGLNPIVSYRIYQTFILPRLLYGLETLPLLKKHIHQLRSFHQGTIRKLQSLPERTATEAVYLLLGALPIEAELHRRQLSLLYTIVTSENETIKNITKRQLSTNFDNPNSFFYTINETLNLYQLDDIHTLLNNKPKKECWKNKCTKAVKEYWGNTLTAGAREKTTLKHMNINNLRIGQSHHLWQSLDNTVGDVRKGITKARLVTGTYLLQVNKHKFSPYTVDPVCPMCRLEPEDAAHMLLRCPSLHTIRQEVYTPVLHKVESSLGSNVVSSFTKADLLQLILDCTLVQPTIPNGAISDIERLTSAMCYKLHMKRSEIQEEMMAAYASNKTRGSI